MVFDRARFNDAGVVDNAGQQCVLRAGAHQHSPAICANHAAIGTLAIQHALVNFHLDQTAVLKSQGDGAACAQRYRAPRRADAALVANAVTQQRHEAARSISTCRFDGTQIHHTAVARAAEAAALAA